MQGLPRVSTLPAHTSSTKMSATGATLKVLHLEIVDGDVMIIASRKPVVGSL